MKSDEPTLVAGLPAELADHPKFRVVRELGRGGMGAVYLAEHRLMGRTVAIKVINRSLLDHPEALPRFLGEIRAAARLGHENIVRAFDAEQAGDLHMLVMEYVEGVSLDRLLARKGPLPVAHTCHFVRQAALGLQYASEQGMTHRDIKPQNLMLTPQGKVKILDFGLARVRGEGAATGLTREGMFMGTPEYVAPEQAADARKADIRADVYSLGCTLYCLLTGRPPFVEDTAMQVVLAHLGQEPRPVHELRPEVPAGLSAVVARMLAKDPAGRYQQPGEVARALAPFCKAKASEGGTARIGAAAPGRAGAGPVDTERPVPAREQTVREASPFAGLDEPAPTLEPAAGGALAAGLAANGRRARKPLLVGAAAAGLVVILGVVVLKVRTGHGDVVIELSEPAASVEVKVDGERVELVGLDRPLSLTAGEHGLTVTSAGFETVTRSFSVKKGEKQVVSVILKPKSAGAVQLAQPAPAVPVRPGSAVAPRGAAAPVYLTRAPGEVWRSPPSTAKILWADFSPAGNYVAVARDNEQVQLWPVSEDQDGQRSFTLRHPVEKEPRLVTGVNFSPDGRWLATVARDGSVVLWSLADIPPKQVARIRAFEGIVTPPAFSPSGWLLAAGVRKPGGDVRVWDLADPANPRPVRSFAAEDPVEVSALTFSKDSATLYVGGGGAATGPRVYAAPVNDPAARVREIWAWPDGRAGSWPRGRFGHWPRGIQVSPDGKELGFAADDKAYLLDLATNQVRLKFEGHQPGTAVVGFAFSPDGTRCLTAGYDKTVRLWSAATGLELWRNDRPHGYNEGASFSPDGRLAFTGCKGEPASENVAQLWRLPDPGAAAERVKPANAGDSFTGLFNGKDLTGWVVAKGPPESWMVKEADLVAIAPGNALDYWLFTDRDFANFILRFEYRLRYGAKASAGVTFRALPTDPVLRPLKLMDDRDRGEWAVQHNERTGSLWAGAAMAPARWNAVLKPAGEWNQAELVLDGKRLILTINGGQVQNMDLVGFARQAGDFPTLTRKAGRIGLQVHTSIVRFRNIRVKELPGARD